MLHAQNYQGQFHWHDSQGRLTIDTCSAATSDGSNHHRFSADFAYHSLKVIMAPVLQAWSSPRTKVDTPAIEPPLLPRAPKHALAIPESLAIPSTASPAPSSPVPHSHDAKMPTKNYFDSPVYGRASPTPLQHGYFDGSPYKTPPTTRKVYFGASSHSSAQRAHSSAFGLSLEISPGPSLSWEHTLNSLASPSPSPTLPPIMTTTF